MPCYHSGRPVDWKRWYACLAKVAKAMAQEGWNQRARKFSAVQQRRALKLYNGVTV